MRTPPSIGPKRNTRAHVAREHRGRGGWNSRPRARQPRFEKRGDRDRLQSGQQGRFPDEPVTCLARFGACRQRVRQRFPASGRFRSSRRASSTAARPRDRGRRHPSPPELNPWALPLPSNTLEDHRRWSLRCAPECRDRAGETAMDNESRRVEPPQDSPDHPRFQTVPEDRVTSLEPTLRLGILVSEQDQPGGRGPKTSRNRPASPRCAGDRYLQTPNAASQVDPSHLRILGSRAHPSPASETPREALPNHLRVRAGHTRCLRGPARSHWQNVEKDCAR